jgi:hypothetical protein
VRFQVLTETSIKIAVFWDVAQCSLVVIYQSFRGTYFLHHQGDKNKEVVSSSEKLLAKKIFSCVTLISEDIQAQCQRLRH